MLELKNPRFMPPGGFAYTQPETGMKFDGNTQLKAQALLVQKHRVANNLERQAYDEAYQDILFQVCVRNPELCIDTDNRVASASVTPRTVRRCGSCGGRKGR